MHASNGESIASTLETPPRAAIFIEAPTPEPGVPQQRRVHLPDRRLPLLCDLEPAGYRFTWLGMLAVVLALYAFTLFTFWAPADAGVDQNAYLVGGKQFAHTFSTRLAPASPFQYIGNMFVQNDKSDYYPKYPLGLPILYATMLWIFGPITG